MKKILLILFLLFGIIGSSYAGGDDRDQELSLNSLNLESTNTLSYIEKSDQDESDVSSENSSANLEELLKEIEEDLKEISELEDKFNNRGFTATFKENYIDSFSGRFILLGAIVLFLFMILLFSTFFSRK